LVKINSLFNKKTKEKRALVFMANAWLLGKNVEQLRSIKISYACSCHFLEYL